MESHKPLTLFPDHGKGFLNMSKTLGMTRSVASQTAGALSFYFYFFWAAPSAQ